MSISKTLSLLIFLSSFSAFAEDNYEIPSFEDTEVFLAPHSVRLKSQSETWSYKFELMKPNGATTTLSSLNPTTMLKPASTMKLFTGWWAFQLNNRSDTYLTTMLRESVNEMANSTQQRMGGVLAMEDYYREHGLEINDDTFQGADGSGLSYDNFTTCATEISLLKLIKRSKTYSRFKKMLAQPKLKGTLKTRLTRLSGVLFAKTGTLDKTAALSGFLETKKGTVIFCVMSDYLNGSIKNARKKIDAMVLKKYSLMK